jgi:hypothetical protein
MNRWPWSTAAAVLVATMVAGPPQVDAAAVPADSGEVALTAEYGGICARVVTRTEVLRRARSFTVSRGQGWLTIAGQRVRMGATLKGKTARLAVDCNGDGRLSSSEYHRLRRSSESFKVRLKNDGGETLTYGLRLRHIVVSRTRGKDTSASGSAYVCSGMKGAINGVPVRVLDDDLSGGFTQDGKDTIAIGRSIAGLPLRKVHHIGEHHYKLEVAADGSKIRFTRMTDVRLGVVRFPIKSSAVACLILTGGDRAYDLKVSGSKGIPAGDYRLGYGVLVSGGKQLALVPTSETPTYPITAEMINTIRIGGPLTLEFSATLSKDRITIYPSMRVLGIGREYYPLLYDSEGNTKPPEITFMNGSKRLRRTTMGYG